MLGRYGWVIGFLILGCGESARSSHDGSSDGGSAGSSSGGSATGGSATGGSSSGGSATGGSAGSVTGGSATGGSSSGGSATGGSTTGGSTTGGSATGGSTTGGSTTGGSATGGAGSGWDAACGDITHNGRCEGSVYRYCDYYSRSVASFDCATRGMTCRATDAIDNEEDTNGCVLPSTCSSADGGCDGSFLRTCYGDFLQLRDCRKNKGPSSSCMDGQCVRSTPCDEYGVTCDGSMARVCDEEGRLYLQNCKQRATTGVCIETTPGSADCEPSLTGDTLE